MSVTYPQLQCRSHGIQPTGYILCVHVREKSEIAHFELATMEQLGTICCAACYSHKNDKDNAYALEHFLTICARCAKDAGFTEIYA